MAVHQRTHLSQGHMPPIQVLVRTPDAHSRQRELVRASLVARPAAPRPMHRRWA